MHRYQYRKLQLAKTAATGPEATAVIDQMLIELIVDDTSLEGVAAGPLGVTGSEDMSMPVSAETPDMQSMDVQPAPVNEISAELPPQGTPQRSTIARTVIKL